ncbi:MAG: dTMP kinase [Acidimicrobiales bacterium]
MAAGRGRLIAIEGGEGAGKSTQAARLAGRLAADLTREPGGTAIGEQLRSLLLDPALGRIDPRTELLLMLAARAQHVAELIEPALAAGRNVVVDRYSGSTLAYQGYGRGLPLEEVRQACSVATAGRWPDLNVLIDVPVATGAARRQAGADRIEAASGDFHERIRQGFLAEAVAASDRWVVVDGTAAPDEVASDIASVVWERLRLGGER